MDLLDALPDGVVVADADGVVIRVNTVAAELLGSDDAVGKHVSEVVALADQQGNGWYDCLSPYDGLNTRTGLVEGAWYLSDGTEVLVTARMLRDGAGPVQQLAVSIRSARGRERLDRERSDLVATVAHELRSPLTGVKGFVSTLLSKWDKLNDEQKKLMLETVHSDAERLTRLIAELLDVARIDTGRLSMFRRPLDFGQALEAAITTLRAGTRRDIEVNVEGDLPLVDADPDKFVQVITNLVDNAIRHGEGVVALTATAIPADNPFRGVLLHVDDDGEGIHPEIRSRVFTKFWRYGSRGGSGLGMYIVHGLVTAHGGTVAIGDAPGGGARISLQWPASAD
jgi:signal transduction histidine kinase